jgi:phosphoribosyl-ATP pyrophosphohydrolase
MMTDATELSDLEIFDLQRRAPRKVETSRGSSEPRQTNITHQLAATSLPRSAGTPVLQEPRSGIAPQSVQPGEIDRLHRSLSEVTPENHPRTARLLASSTRKTAQKVIEEAGEVALEAVKHHTRGIVRESADLLYHLVALWHRAGIDPGEVWAEMRSRADTLGIAEKRPKARSDDRCRPIRNVKLSPERNRP